MNVLMGKNIKRIITLNSMYGNGMIEVNDMDGVQYRLKVDDLLPLLRQMQFPIEQKRKYGHLKVSDYHIKEAL